VTNGTKDDLRPTNPIVVLLVSQAATNAVSFNAFELLHHVIFIFQVD